MTFTGNAIRYTGSVFILSAVARRKYVGPRFQFRGLPSRANNLDMRHPTLAEIRLTQKTLLQKYSGQRNPTVEDPGIVK
jgi:hypothetical protein